MKRIERLAFAVLATSLIGCSDAAPQVQADADQVRSGGSAATGGRASGSGGNVGTGGSVDSGGSVATGGTRAAGGSGGSSTMTTSVGGAAGSGGAKTDAGSASTGGIATTGGSIASGGTVGTGGSTSTGTGVASCAGADPAEFTRVTGWLKNTTSVNALPNYAYNNIKTYFSTQPAFDKLVCSIVMSCTEWAPSLPSWLLYCEAVITSAIVSESSYNPAGAPVYDTYARRAITGGTADDPTVGLLQDRFSSTVNAFNYNGPVAKMAAIGCNWPPELLTLASSSSAWSTAGGTTYLSFMEDPACNVGLGTWFYFHNATGNGGPTVVWTQGICAGNGIAGNMIDGLLSHLQGGNYARPADASNSYVTGIKARFALLLGGLPSPDPFTQVLPPEPSKYCK